MKIEFKQEKIQIQGRTNKCRRRKRDITQIYIEMQIFTVKRVISSVKGLASKKMPSKDMKISAQSDA